MSESTGEERRTSTVQATMLRTEIAPATVVAARRPPQLIAMIGAGSACSVGQAQLVVSTSADLVRAIATLDLLAPGGSPRAPTRNPTSRPPASRSEMAAAAQAGPLCISH